MLLGLGYKAGVGKDTVGNYLVSKYGWKKLSFATNLKTACSYIFKLDEQLFYDDIKKNLPFASPIVISAGHFYDILDWMEESIGVFVRAKKEVLIASIGKVINSPRELLQFVGSDIMRAHIPDYHLLACFKNISSSDNYVVCDVRFPNEAEGIVSNGGLCIKINRPSSLKDTRSKHLSEVALDSWSNWAYTLDNSVDGLPFLYEKTDNLMEEIEHGRKR